MLAETISVLLADDHPLVRAGMRTTLTAEPDIVLVGEATDGYEAQRLCEELQPNVLLLDLNMPGPRPVETVGWLRQVFPNIKVLVLTAYDDDAYVRGLLSAGVAGYVLKDEAPETVVHAIRAVVRGGSWFSRSVVDKLVRQRTQAPNGLEEETLTDREQQLLAMIAQGWDNTRIAAELNLAEQTVRNYISRLYQKMGVRTRGEAIVWARERGLDGA